MPLKFIRLTSYSACFPLAFDQLTNFLTHLLTLVIGCLYFKCFLTGFKLMSLNSLPCFKHIDCRVVQQLLYMGL